MKQFYLITEVNELEELTGLTQDELWNAGVCLDDWEYFLAIKTKESPVKFVDTFTPKDEIWERLLDGCCSNDWFHISSPNGNFFIGGAYHA